MWVLKKNNVIAFCGLKATGKDTSAQMLKYLLNTPKCLHFYWMYKHFGFLGNYGKWKITSFAKPLKQVLSIILGVPVKLFEDRNFKEFWVANLKDTEVKFLSRNSNLHPISDKLFSKHAKSHNVTSLQKYDLTIRQWLQYVGTDVLRSFISENVWINATLRRDNIIISDLRFKQEFNALDHYKSFRILIERPGCEPGNHISEQEILELKTNRNFEGYINNNGTLKDLFYKIKEII